MPHVKYKTEALVLGTAEKGEASMALHLLTRDFGLIWAQAQGLRYLKSKLRYSLQNLSHSQVSLVRGKSGWRVVSGREIRSLTPLVRLQNGEENPMLKTLSFIKKVLKGEEKNERLFDIIMSALLFSGEGGLQEEDVKNLEALVVLRALENLGYLDGKEFPNLVEDSTISPAILKAVAERKEEALEAINRSLRASQMV